MPSIDWNAVLTGAITSALGGLIAWLAVKSSSAGQRFWLGLGTEGLRSVAKIAIVALLLALGAVAAAISFRTGMSNDELQKLSKLAGFITEIDGARICFRKPGWDGIDCFENGNFTAHFDKSTKPTDRGLADIPNK